MTRSSGTRFLFGWFLACVIGLACPVALAAGSKPTAKDLKISQYIDIINAESNHLIGNYERYTARLADVRKGPTCKELGPQDRVSTMGEVSERVKVYRKGLAKKPKLETDVFATEMVDALEQLEKPVAEASDYYFTSKSDKDNCKRGGELHPILMAGWTKYITAERSLRAFLDKYTDERDEKELTEVQKKYGKGLHYHHNKLMTDAKALLRVTDLKQRDLAAIREKLATLEATLAETTALVEKEKANKKNANALYEGGYEQLVKTAQWFRDSVKDVIRVQENEAKDPKSAASTNSGPTAMKNLVSSYNGLVEQSNQTMYSKTMK